MQEAFVQQIVFYRATYCAPEGWGREEREREREREREGERVEQVASSCDWQEV